MASVEELQQHLQEAIEHVASLPSGACDAEVAAFNKLRHPVTQASSGVVAPPADLLDVLEPKDVILRFLFDLHERKRMYRKQISAVVAILLEQPAWQEALRGDEALCTSMPSELRTCLEEEQQPAVIDHALTTSSRPLPDMHGPGDSAELRDFKDTAGYNAAAGSTQAPVAAAAPADVEQPPVVVNKVLVAELLELLDQARRPMEDLDYSATNADNAIDAFELFRKSLNRVVKSSGPEGSVALDELEPKGKVLEFLVDFKEKQRKYGNRVSSVLLQLFGHEDWKAAVDHDPSVGAAVRELTQDLDKPRRLTVVSAGQAVNLGAAAASALGRGGVGALYVRVIAGHNLVGVDEGKAHRKPDPYVRITLDGRMKRTNVASLTKDPHWDSSPFLMSVPSEDAIVKFEVLDSDLMKDELLGSVSIAATKAGRKPGFSRHKLEDADSGELEIELVYMPGVDAVEEAKATSKRGSLISGASEKGEGGGEDDELEASDPPLAFAPTSRGSFLVSRPGQPSEAAPGNEDWKARRGTDVSLADGEGGEAPASWDHCCPAGHPIEKRKKGLRWHQGLTGHQRSCDHCGHDFVRDEARWRCKFHCDFDVCEGCYSPPEEPAAAA